MRSGILTVLLILAASMGLFPSAVEGGAGWENAASTTHVVFGVGDAADETSDLFPAVRHPIVSLSRSRVVEVDSILSERDGIARGDVLELDLFPDARHTAHVDRVVVDVNGVTTVRGRLAGSDWGYVLFSTHEGRTLGVIEIPETGERYEVRHDPVGRRHVLLQVDEIAPFECAVIDVPGLPRTVHERSRSGHDPFEPVLLDVMIAYTPAARSHADAHMGGIHNALAQAMGLGQLALDNSTTHLMINLVHSPEITYQDSGNITTDLERLTTVGDGHLEEVHALRDLFGADLVALFSTSDSAAGVAYLPVGPQGSPAYGFSVTSISAANTFTFIHEIGHNLGCHHHKSGDVPPGPGLFNYSAGWRWTGNDGGRYRSVMSYNVQGSNYSRVPHFSNPAVQYRGVATGHATNGDNARTIREFKHVAAGYRERPSLDLFEDAAVLVGDCGGAWGQNTQAGKETGEPHHAGHPGGASIWWQWTARDDGVVTFTTEGSSFDTLLGVYTGGSVGQLTEVASNNNAGVGVGFSRVTFEAVAGTTYRIAVDRSGSQTGIVRLEWCLMIPGSLAGWGWDYSLPSPNRGFLTIATGYEHYLGLRADGSVFGWGDNSSGKLDVPSPNAGFVSLSGGGTHSLGLKADGSIAAWGSNNRGQRNVPAPNANFVAVAAGYSEFSLGLKSDGTIVSWGTNSHGQRNIPSPNRDFVSVAAGYYHGLGLKANGTVVSWGSLSSNPSPNNGFVAISAGYEQNLGLKADGSVVAWGSNTHGQRVVPAPNENFTAISSGGRHNLGLKSDGSVVGWGDNVFGQTTVPLQNASFSSVSAGWVSSMALRGMGDGQLTVQIQPPPARNAGAQWRRIGSGTWRNSGEMETNVPAGGHIIEFRAIEGWIKPDLKVHLVTMEEMAVAAGEYIFIVPPDFPGEALVVY